MDRLVRVVEQSDGFTLALVRSNEPLQRKELIQALKARLAEKRFLEVSFSGPIISLLDVLGERWNKWDADGPPDAVCVSGFEASMVGQREFSPALGRLNNDRDLLRRAIPAPLLLWLPEFAIDLASKGAPDFWAWRSGIYEFLMDTTASALETGAMSSMSANVSLDLALPLKNKHKEIANLRTLVDSALALTAPGKRECETLASLLYRLADLHHSLGEHETATSLSEESLRFSERAGYDLGVAKALHALGVLKQGKGLYDEARELYERSVEKSREVGDEEVTAGTLHQLGILAQVEGRNEAAKQQYLGPLEIYRRFDNQLGIAAVLNNMGLVAMDDGEYNTSENLLQESLRLAYRLGNEDRISRTLHNLGTLARLQGDYSTARHKYDESLRIKRLLGNQAGIALTLWTLGVIERQSCNSPSAVRLLAQSLEILNRLESPQANGVDEMLGGLRKDMTETAFLEALADARESAGVAGAVWHWLAERTHSLKLRFRRP